MCFYAANLAQIVDDGEYQIICVSRDQTMLISSHLLDVNDDGADDIVEIIYRSDAVCVHVHTRSSSLGVTAVLGSCILQ